MTQTGSIAFNFHKGTRSEYLAQYVFSSFGTSFPVPHQEDTGIDLYCTILERVSKRAWPRAYYTVQVKSSADPWILESPESVKWLLEYPLPFFYCVVEKTQARFRIYHTTPRFACWAIGLQRDRMEMRFGTESRASTVDGTTVANTFEVKAPILEFTIDEILDPEFHSHVSNILKWWINLDVENLRRVQNGIRTVRVPHEYVTNSLEASASIYHGSHFYEGDSIVRPQGQLEELVEIFIQQYMNHGDFARATLWAMALRDLLPNYESGKPTRHNAFLHMRLNETYGMAPPQNYAYEACDTLSTIVREELARHGIVDRSKNEAEDGPKS